MTLDRPHKLIVGALAAGVILLVRLFAIQILDGSYKEDASNNSMLYETVYPTRGIIYDRNGRILVGNTVAYDILVTPREVRRFDTLALARILEVSPGFIRDKLEECHRYRTRIGFQSVTLLKKVPSETYVKFAELEYKFPGFKAQMRSIRQYPYNAGGNLLGYVSEVDGDFLKNHQGEYRPGDYIGKTGIEAAREKRPPRTGI